MFGDEACGTVTGEITGDSDAIEGAGSETDTSCVLDLSFFSRLKAANTSVNFWVTSSLEVCIC